MCLAVPLKIINIEGDFALAEFGGLKKKINIQMLANDVEVGSYVIVHAGFAIEKIDLQAAIKTLNLTE